MKESEDFMSYIWRIKWGQEDPIWGFYSNPSVCWGSGELTVRSNAVIMEAQSMQYETQVRRLDWTEKS